jgi:hypothetical protein
MMQPPAPGSSGKGSATTTCPKKNEIEFLDLVVEHLTQREVMDPASLNRPSRTSPRWVSPIV